MRKRIKCELCGCDDENDLTSILINKICRWCGKHFVLYEHDGVRGIVDLDADQFWIECLNGRRKKYCEHRPLMVRGKNKGFGWMK